MTDDHHITAGTETLFRQTAWTALEYMVNACKNIDGFFGEGFAKQHPELVGQYMLTCAIDLHAGVVARAIESAGREIEDAANQLHSIASEVENVADQLEAMTPGEPS